MAVSPLKIWRRVRIPLIIVILGIGASLLVSLQGSVPSADDGKASGTGSGKGVLVQEAAMTVTVTRLIPRELARTITVNGSIHAWQEIIISPEVGGYRVAEVNVDVGDKVTRGQELVRLSSTLLEADVDSKRALVNQRKAELTNAEAEQKRAQALSKQHVLSASDLDRLNSDAQAARARLESARADLESSAVRLQFTHVTAPDDGVITSRTVTVGQISQVGSEMLRLLRQNRVEWRGEVPESRLAELHPGQKVTVKLAGGQVLDGVVRVVAPTISTSNRTGLVYADIDAHGYARPGMFASGEIEISHGSALTAPLSSIVSADGYNYLFVLRPDNTVERRKVEIGQVREANVEIISGVSAGELVVNKGAGFLKNGDLVNVAEAG